jgi:hypothetical protein
MQKYFFIGFVFFVSLSACNKKDKAIVLPPQNGGSYLQTNMGENYENQFFIDLSTRKIVYTSPINNWELAFESNGNSNGIFLNGGKNMACYNTHDTNFSTISENDTSKTDFKWSYDKACGLIDSNAIGKWANGFNTNNDVYIVKLNNSGKDLSKLRILSSDLFQYIIEVGDINSSFPAKITIPKNEYLNYTYFSFYTLSTVENVEPAKKNWDITLTRYNNTFYDQKPALNYVVVGCLLNPSNTVAYKDSLTDYNKITKQFAEATAYSKHRDVIGFNWKKYDFGVGTYTIAPNYNYIIKTQDDRYFKLRFLDFYSATGVKGSPKFEFQPLL